MSKSNNKKLNDDLKKKYPNDKDLRAKINNDTTTIDLINAYTIYSREIILLYLTSDYGFDEQHARKAEESIYLSTSSKMMELYTFENPYVVFKSINTKDKTPREKFELNNTPLDFMNWVVTCLSIPFYQSFGDTLGYQNGRGEINANKQEVGPDFINELISEFIYLGGVNDLSIKNWRASDDSILYMATYEVLTDMVIKENTTGESLSINEFGKKIKEAYEKVLPIIKDRFPGERTMESLIIQQNSEWDTLRYDNRAIGNGSVMRSGCIGFFYPGTHNRAELIALAVESSRITHNSATAILGSVTAALFTAYALEKVPINTWPHKLIKFLKSGRVDNYMQKSRPTEYPLFAKDKGTFIGQWQKYVELLFIESGINPRTDLKIMNNPVHRYKYLIENFSKGCEFPGGCADDCLIMAYHALLQSNGVFEKVIVYSILHPGDSDTVGSVALSWFGAYYNSSRMLRLIGHRFEQLEFFGELYDLYKKNIPNMVKTFYFDIYMDIAVKYLKKIPK